MCSSLGAGIPTAPPGALHRDPSRVYLAVPRPAGRDRMGRGSSVGRAGAAAGQRLGSTGGRAAPAGTPSAPAAPSSAGTARPRPQGWGGNAVRGAAPANGRGAGDEAPPPRAGHSQWGGAELSLPGRAAAPPCRSAAAAAAPPPAPRAASGRLGNAPPRAASP